MVKSVLNRLAVVLVLGFVAWAYYSYASNKIAAQAEMIETLEGQVAAADRAIAELQEVVAEERRTDVIVRELVEVINESPNAQTPIPDDLALAWHSGIERLRNDAGCGLGAGCAEGV